MTLIPFDDRDGVIWFNGAMVPWRDAKVHALSHGLHYGSCVFEGERVYGRKIFKLREHTERFFASAKALGFEIPFTRDEIEAASLAVVAEQGIVDGYMRPVAWRGSEMMAVSARKNRIHVVIAAWPWPTYFSAEARMRGIRLDIAKWRRPAPDTAPTAAKAAGLYMICTLSKHAAEDAGFDDALMLDYRGQVAEATGANIFLVQNGELHTPTPDCFLDGITRRTVIGLAKARGIKVVERAIMPEEFAKTQEVFLTGTAVEVTPVGEIGPYKFTVGPVTRQLMEDYERLVRDGKTSAASAA
ncbi:MAG TPA: branched-chain amino acid aminotransferase [Alphaproteobacteria bacterium]|nr:branched-chain amino acid aminotransferase [Alphaproteobacteria bacterium]